MSAHYISQLDRRRFGGPVIPVGKRGKKPLTLAEHKRINKIKNDFIGQQKDLGLALDRKVAERVFKATGLECTDKFVSRYRNKQVPKIQSAYALKRNNMQRNFAPNRIEILIQGWGR